MKIYKLYNLDGSFINTLNFVPNNFTGISEYLSGTKYWFVNGKYHRLDGPAVEYLNGTKYWFVDGNQVTELQCKCLHSIMKLKKLL